MHLSKFPAVDLVCLLSVRLSSCACSIRSDFRLRERSRSAGVLRKNKRLLRASRARNHTREAYQGLFCMILASEFRLNNDAWSLCQLSRCWSGPLNTQVLLYKLERNKSFFRKKNGTANWQVIKVGLKESFIEGFTTRKMSKGTGCMCPLVPVF